MKHSQGNYVYTYTPAGRLESEVREGQVWYSRYYKYNLDGSRAMVMRDDALNGTHWDMYGYDAASGRLASVQDVWTGEAIRFCVEPGGHFGALGAAEQLCARVWV
jgi:hypothetical protein